jgi:ATP-dependent helicase HrpA
MNFRLAAPDGVVIAQSRDLAQLKHAHGDAAAKAFAESAGERLARQGLHGFPEAPVPVQVSGAAGVPAYTALVDEGESVSLVVFADAAQARAEHGRGVRRLVQLSIADKVKQARKQLPVSPKLGLLYAAIESSERLRADIVDAALNALLSDGLQDVRDRAAFDARVALVSRQLFEQSMQRLQLAESILAAYAEVKPRLESKLLGWARGNLDDISEHLRSLVHAGFLRDTPADFLAEFPRYLKALALRVERAIADPLKDQARMLELQPYVAALREAGDKAGEEGWLEFRRDLEELRVQAFAQELGTRRTVSHKRMARQLEALR